MEIFDPSVQAFYPVQTKCQLAMVAEEDSRAYAFRFSFSGINRAAIGIDIKQDVLSVSAKGMSLNNDGEYGHAYAFQQTCAFPESVDVDAMTAVMRGL